MTFWSIQIKNWFSWKFCK